jgi:DNA ligase-1
MKPMLAAKCTDIRKLRYPLYASPKLDGVRAVINRECVLSRKLLSIPNKYVQSLFGRSILDGLDGELIVGEAYASTVYRDTTSGVMSVAGEPAVRLYVFDVHTMWDKPYPARLAHLQARARNWPKNVVLLPQTEIKTPDQLTAYEMEQLSLGYEGVMLRSFDSSYKFGRSTEREQWLLKLKRFEDAEATIIGFEELQHNENEATKDNLGRMKRSSHKENRVGGGVLGSFIVQGYGSKFSFGIGSGFTADERVKFWEARKHLLGKIVKYQYFPGGGKERPRFPTFLGFRSKIDL